MKSKKSNIAEYILYLWQIEDYLRAFPEAADHNQELTDLSNMLHQENIMAGGHLRLALNAMDELEALHREVLDEDATYRAAMIRLQPALNILKSKTDTPTMSDIEACLTLLYQVMMLRLQKKPISPQTNDALQQATGILRHLSRLYAEQD